MQRSVLNNYANNHIENNINEPMIDEYELLLKCHDVSSQKRTSIFTVVVIKCSYIFSVD